MDKGVFKTLSKIYEGFYRLKKLTALVKAPSQASEFLLKKDKRKSSYQRLHCVCYTSLKI